MAKKKTKKEVVNAVPKWDGFTIKDDELYQFEWHSDKMVSVMDGKEIKKYLAPNKQSGKVLGFAPSKA